MNRQPHHKGEIDVGLDVLCRLASDGETMTVPDIAEVCGCSAQRIYEIQQKALEKARRIANRLNLIDFYYDL
jgi:DNA-directed RNA polymerase sigma subunit (sigma70/sigma32)